MTDQAHDVCAAVVSDLPFDARVWKEARSLRGHGYQVALLGCRYDIPAMQRRNEDGVSVVEIPFGGRTGRPSKLRRARTLVGLWLEVLRTPARVYHAHNIHTGPVAWLASRMRRARLVYDAHELYGEASGAGIGHRMLARLELALERFMVRRSAAVITTNPTRARILGDRHGRGDVQVLGNVPAIAAEVEPLDPGYPKGRSILLYQGGIYARSRAFKETIEALTALEGVDLVVLGFGRSTDLDLIRDWAAEADVSNRVHFLPPRPFDELVRTAAAATVGLVPIKPDSLNNRLGDTNKLYEYLMAGLPVAASDLPEIRRVAASGDPPVGELFDPFSSGSIVEAVKRLLEDRDTYEARRREARRLALERHNWQVEERRLLGVYERVLGGPTVADGGLGKNDS